MINTDEFDAMGVLFVLLGIGIIIFGVVAVHEHNKYVTDYGLGNVVTTTTEYEYLTNDSFTGVIVRNSYNDQEVTIRTMDGEERTITTKFLKPME